MTNREKFREVFGFDSCHTSCPMPNKVCIEERNRSGDIYFSCRKCTFFDWWNKEYKSCFKLKEGFND